MMAHILTGLEHCMLGPVHAPASLGQDTSPGTLYLSHAEVAHVLLPPSCPRTFALAVSSAWNAFPSLWSSKLLLFFSLSLIITAGEAYADLSKQNKPLPHIVNLCCVALTVLVIVH